MDKKLNIVVLEDIPQDAELIEHALSRDGLAFKIRRAATAQEFVSAIQDTTPDVILADYHLPQFNALEALDLARAQWPATPFILVTGSQTEEVAADCIKRGADDYVLKSNLQRLPTALANALAKKETEGACARAFAALKQRETLYRLITENTGDLVCLLDRNGHFLYASPSYQTSLNYAPESLIGKSALSLVHFEDAASFSQTFLQGATSGVNPKAEMRYQHGSAAWRLFESIGSWLSDEADTPRSILIVSRDVTERRRAEEQLKRSHEQLRALSARVHAILESEKTRVAREIHDDFAQKLTALAIELSLLDSGFEETGHELPTRELHAKIKHLYELTDGMIKSARQLEAQLRPKVLDEFGLAAALEWQTFEFAKETGIKCQFTANPEDLLLERNFSTEIFRIFQEILSNVAHHANASRVVVRVQDRSGQLTLEVRDDGKGVTSEKLSDPKSLGLLGMKERASLLGGTVQIERAAGGGTLVRVLAPAKRPPRRTTGACET